MAITTSFLNQAKRDFLSGTHQPGNTYKLGLFKSSVTGSYGPGGVRYYADLSGDEHAATGNYTAGGVTLTGIAYLGDAATATASIDWLDASWTSATIASAGAFLYNSTAASSPVIAVFDFGGTISSTNGTFTVTIPSSGNGVIRIS